MVAFVTNPYFSRSKQHPTTLPFLTTRTATKVSSFDNDHDDKTVPKNPWTSHDKDLLHRNLKPDLIPDNIDYIIIGSGIGGLWLAACLSKFQKKCLVLEQHYTAGGLQHTFTKKGYEFVPGLHYIANLNLCAPLYQMVATNITEYTHGDVPELRYIRAGDAVPADRMARMMEYEPIDTTTTTTTTSTSTTLSPCSHELQIGNLPRLRVREGLDRVRSELVRVFPDQSKHIDAFLQLMERAKWQAGQFATFKIFPQPLQFLLSQILCSNYMHYASLTTDEVLTQIHIHDGRLKTVLSAFGGDLGESLADGSFVMQAAVLGHVLEGCWYPESGPIHFVRGLVPTIRNAGGDVLVNARVQQIEIENGRAIGVSVASSSSSSKTITVRAKQGIVSDAGILSTLQNLLPTDIVRDGPLRQLYQAVQSSSGGISHVFAFVGLNASTEELGLRSSSFYYIPWNETNSNMDATAIQDYYRDTLLDPTVLDVSAGMVFCTAKDPHYSAITMPGKSTVIIFSEARAEDFQKFVLEDDSGKGKKHLRNQEYETAKKLIKFKMMRSLFLNFPHLEPYVDLVEVGTPLTLFDYTLRMDTLGLRHTPQRMTDMEIRPDCEVPGLYFTGQDISFAGWAGALSGAMVTAQYLLGYTLMDFARGKTLLRDLGRGHVEDMIQSKLQAATQASPAEVAAEIFGNAARRIQKKSRMYKNR